MVPHLFSILVVTTHTTLTGKTLAYLLPLMDDILQRKAAAAANNDNTIGYDYARALILVPNKELVQQVVRMAMVLAGGPESVVYGGWTLADAAWWDAPDNQQKLTAAATSMTPPEQIVRLAIMPGGLKAPNDYPPFRNAVPLGGTEPVVDLIVSTPASIGPLGLSPKNIGMFADIQTVVVDEADMLLDGGYIRQLENVFLGFKRADRLDSALLQSKTQHVFVAATLPDSGLRSVEAYLQRKFPRATRVQLAGMHQARHSGLRQATDWNRVESKKERLRQLVDLLRTPSADGGLQGEKVMVFLNTVEDVQGASQALEKEGFDVLSYHAKIPLAERTAQLDRFRRFTAGRSNNPKDAVGVLVCSDLAARGIDVPGVNAVVQLQMAGNVVGHLHRMGRCGRAGQRTGRGIVYYSEQETELVKVIQEAESQQERMVLEGADVLDFEEPEEAGKVTKAFSRRRGFNKKLKKQRKRSAEVQE